MPIVDGSDFENVTEEDRAQIRKFIEESGDLSNISEGMRAFIELEMPDLVKRLPPRVVN